ncbi:MAG: glycoside hydrolase family 99-like domain-containing protein [Bacteroidaceae bacterium]|nr:glycoside hydrolase family 99-like domain-containing protein [Bacteroidaceae bacterium]
MKKFRTIAIYLPQYHRTKENDEWWGQGFTEWTNVTKAKPRFRGHYQPHLPKQFGFYDLRVPEALEEHATFAKEYGIDGFCFYHYWFSGKLMLEFPLEQMLKRKSPNFPFMICWANGDWNAAWTGNDNKILLKQEYSDDDDRAHFKYLLPFFLDSRYIRIDGKPVISIYRSFLNPNIEHSLEIWREEARKVGMELYICRMESMGREGIEYMKGFDAGIEFQPHNHNGFMKQYEKWFYIIQSKLHKLSKKIENKPLLFPYDKYVEFQETREYPTDYKYYPAVTPSWDNSARKGKLSFFAFTGSTPALYGRWLKNVLTKFSPYSKEENLVFINAWNEWAEGNHLEPDQKWDLGYLEATKDVIDKFNKEL